MSVREIGRFRVSVLESCRSLASILSYSQEAGAATLLDSRVIEWISQILQACPRRNRRDSDFIAVKLSLLVRSPVAAGHQQVVSTQSGPSACSKAAAHSGIGFLSFASAKPPFADTCSRPHAETRLPPELPGRTSSVTSAADVNASAVRPGPSREGRSSKRSCAALQDLPSGFVTPWFRSFVRRPSLAAGAHEFPLALFQAQRESNRPASVTMLAAKWECSA